MVRLIVPSSTSPVDEVNNRNIRATHLELSLRCEQKQGSGLLPQCAGLFGINVADLVRYVPFNIHQSSIDYIKPC